MYVWMNVYEYIICSCVCTDADTQTRRQRDIRKHPQLLKLGHGFIPPTYTCFHAFVSMCLSECSRPHKHAHSAAETGKPLHLLLPSFTADAQRVAGSKLLACTASAPSKS